MSANTQYLFAYGTLKSDQPEHALHCVPPLSIVKAKVRGALWKLREGYPILEVDPSAALLDAGPNPVDDWAEAQKKSENGGPPQKPDTWINGELMEYPMDGHVLDKMDKWENFTPHLPGPYQRRLIWVLDESGTDRMAWCYVCFSPPDWATLISEDHWDARMA